MPDVVETRITRDFVELVAKKLGPASSIQKYGSGGPPMDTYVFDDRGATFTAESLGRQVLLQFPDGSGQQKWVVTMNAGCAFVAARVRPDKAVVGVTLQGNQTLWLVDPKSSANWAESWGESGVANPAFTGATADLFASIDDLSAAVTSAIAAMPSSDQSGFLSAPLCEALLYRNVFSGLSNYIRAEMFIGTGIDPFQRTQYVVQDGATLKMLLQSAQKAAAMAYWFGGDQLNFEPSAWVNPFGVAAKPFADWLTIYGKKQKITDADGWTFWYDGTQFVPPPGFPTIHNIPTYTLNQ